MKGSQRHEMGKRFAIVIGVAAAGVMALGAQTVAAVPITYDTKLTITYSVRGPTYFGGVLSEVRNCMDRRRVIVFKQRPGPDRRIAAARSYLDPQSGEGDWFLRQGQGPPASERVYAKVKPKVRDGFVCRADRSPTI